MAVKASASKDLVGNKDNVCPNLNAFSEAVKWRGLSELGLEGWKGFYFLFFCFLGPNLQHMEAPRLGVQSEL